MRSLHHLIGVGGHAFTSDGSHSQMVTVVTMFFDLNKLPGASPSTRSYESYMVNARGTLGAAAPMVVFCDSSTKPEIQKIRDELSKYPTVYVERNIGDYDFYQMLYPLIVENRIRSPAYKDPNERNTPSYFLTTSFKFHAIYLAYSRGYFPESSHYMWLDFACSHAVTDVPVSVAAILNNPHPKIACAAIHYRSKRELYPMIEYLKWGGPCSLVGGAMTVQREYVVQLYLEAVTIMYTQIQQGVGHADEQVLVYIYDRNPEWFTLYYSDYRSCLTNYHRSVHDHQTIRTFFIANALADGRTDLAKAAEDSFHSNL